MSSGVDYTLKTQWLGIWFSPRQSDLHIPWASRGVASMSPRDAVRLLLRLLEKRWLIFPGTHDTARIEGLKGLKLPFAHVGLENKANTE